MECGKAPCAVRKVKKKQVKDDLDRIKQAEKKKRRLEKALATSAAIISELEKKKLKKKEEQERLDEECAAIAEAVALRVLIGEESESDESCVRAGDFDVFGARTTAAVYPHPHQLSGSPNGDNTGWVSGSGCGWSGYGLSGDGYFLSDGGEAPYVVERGWEDTEVSTAISSLQIADDGVNAFVFNRMLRG